MSRPNKCIKDVNGKEYWISRSTVVIPVVFKLDENTGDIYTLVEKRGPAVSHTDEWCCPCGYLDWDEDTKQACQREVLEETGIELNPEKILFVEADSTPNSTNQTIDFWYMCWVDNNSDVNPNKIQSADEVQYARWLKVANVYKSGLFKRKINVTIYKKIIYDCYGPWAFKSHKDRIIEMLKMLVKRGKVIIK